MAAEKTATGHWFASIILGILCAVFRPLPASAADQIYFPATTDVTSILVQKINAETVRIDMSAWYLSEHAISIALANRFNAGVPVRLLGDRGAIFELDPNTRKEFYWLASQGVPIRLRYNPDWYPEIDHWKATIFAGQNLVSFGSANYTPFELAPFSPTNYKDETVMFSDDQAIVKAFRTKFDQMWNDTTVEPNSMILNPPFFKNWDQACALESACSDYRVQYPHPVPMSINTARLEPNNPMPADLIWGQGPLFNNRLISEINREPIRVEMVAYRITVEAVADAMIAKVRAGVPVRFITEPDQYTARQWPEFWLTHAFVDKMWAAGVQVKQRVHGGLTHMKMLVTSSYATNASSNIAANWERDHNYFVPAATKPAIYQAMTNRFDAMWNDPSAFAPLTPLPPDSATLAAPATGTTGLSTRPTLVWDTAAFAVSYDVYLGTGSPAMSFVGNVPAQLTATPPSTYSWTPPTPLLGGRTYYWKVVSRTFATDVNPSIAATSETRTFKTKGGVAGDFDADGRADVMVYRPATGTWWILKSSTGLTAWDSYQWGAPGDIPVVGDYDGDGKTDVAVYRPTNGTWWILKSSTNHSSWDSFQWGASGDTPVVGDYDGDGKTDVTVYRPATGTWWILKSSTNRKAWDSFQWGVSTDVPVRGDYDGDGRADVAVYRPATGTWWILKSTSNFTAWSTFQWGVPADVAVPGDYDGDGKTDVAIYRPDTGTWWILRSSTNFTAWGSYQWGVPTDVPVPGDYDGDGKSDVAVYRPSTGVWWILKSATNFTSWDSFQWGVGGDVPAR